MDLVEFIRPYTRTGPSRIRAWLDAIRYADDREIAGDVVECGVWRGGNIILARMLSPTRVCWLYDTFTGMTEPGPEDMNRAGKKAIKRYKRENKEDYQWCVAPLSEVRDNLAETGTLDDSRLRFVVGDVCKTLNDPANLPERIALLRLDTDWYESTKKELEVLYPRLVPGGVLVIDDYGHWMGARKAADEYFGADFRWKEIDYSARMMVK